MCDNTLHNISVKFDGRMMMLALPVVVFMFWGAITYSTNEKSKARLAGFGALRVRGLGLADFC